MNTPGQQARINELRAEAESYDWSVSYMFGHQLGDQAVVTDHLGNDFMYKAKDEIFGIEQAMIRARQYHEIETPPAVRYDGTTALPNNPIASGSSGSVVTVAHTYVESDTDRYRAVTGKIRAAGLSFTFSPVADGVYGTIYRNAGGMRYAQERQNPFALLEHLLENGLNIWPNVSEWGMPPLVAFAAKERWSVHEDIAQDETKGKFYAHVTGTNVHEKGWGDTPRAALASALQKAINKR